MRPHNRIITNTFAQYFRTFVNVIISLYTVRLVLSALGEVDYGLYILVAGVAAMLSFLINSLTATTQRFVCYHQGKSDLNTLKDVFSNSVILHFLVGLLLVFVLQVISPFLFDGFLNVPIDRLFAVKCVYVTIVVSLFFSFITAPFKALLISHENIVYISIVEIFDCFLKLALVLILINVSYDKLIFYSIIMLGRHFVFFLLLSLFCFFKYEECILPSIARIKMSYLKEMVSFAGWSIYGTGCILARQQGIAIVLNKFYGASMNAAYGIGFQIAGHTSFLSTSLSNAISPQIIKAEGAGDRKKSLELSCTSCKMMFFLLTTLCIPCIFEIDSILNWWLKVVPANASLFCIMVLLAHLCDSLTLGLSHVNQAVGKIKLYNICSNTPKLLTLPIILILSKKGTPLFLSVCFYVGIEFLCAIIRLIVVHYTTGLKISVFFSSVIKKEVVPIFIFVSVCGGFTNCFSFSYRFVFTFLLCIPIYMIAVYFCGLSIKEKELLSNLIKRIFIRK